MNAVEYSTIWWWLPWGSSR